jgi:hypothetical protein
MQSYVVLLAEDPSDLSSQVCRLLKLGWKVQGGVALVEVRDEEEKKVSTATQWAQAMIREGEFANDSK